MKTILDRTELKKINKKCSEIDAKDFEKIIDQMLHLYKSITGNDHPIVSRRPGEEMMSMNEMYPRFED